VKNIIVADDKEEIINSINDMLAPFYRVDVATTGSEVLRMCYQNAYHGLIIDVSFGPGMSGLEVASILRARDKAIKILIFSAIDYSDEVRQHVVDIGAAFCEKPLSLEFVRKTLGD
jgi:DNA-binding response OmpR family regulator